MAKILSSQTVIKAAQKNGFKVKECPGSHFKVVAPSGDTMTCYHAKEISIGVSSKIIKWFRNLGIVLAIVLACLWWMCYL